MPNQTAKRVVELPYVGVVLLVCDDGVETITGVEFPVILRTPKQRTRSDFGTVPKTVTPER